MKIKSLLLVATTLAAAATLGAAEKAAAGPKGGRILAATPHPTEFFVTPDRRVEINFYDGTLKPVGPGTQVVTVTAEPKAGRLVLELAETATGFVSRNPLPARDEVYRVVVQVREAASAPPKNFRIDLKLDQCAECQHAEYACTCAGH